MSPRSAARRTPTHSHGQLGCGKFSLLVGQGLGFENASSQAMTSTAHSQRSGLLDFPGAGGIPVGPFLFLGDGLAASACLDWPVGVHFYKSYHFFSPMGRYFVRRIPGHSMSPPLMALPSWSSAPIEPSSKPTARFCSFQAHLSPSGGARVRPRAQPWLC